MPMDRNQQNQRPHRGKKFASTRTNYGGDSPPREDPDIWNSLSVPSSPAFRLPSQTPTPYYDPSHYSLPTPQIWYRSADTLRPYSTPGGSNSIGNNPMHAFWNSNAEEYQSRAGGSGGHYDLASQFTSGTDITGSTPSQRQYPLGLQEEDSVVERYEKPSQEEISSRNPRYNIYGWQQNLKERYIVDIYKKIGAHWGLLSSTTIKRRIDALNASLNGKVGVIKAILDGEQSIIEQLANELAPKKNKKASSSSAGNMTVEMWLNDFSPKKKHVSLKVVEEEPTPDRQGHERPSWVPERMDDDTGRQLVEALTHIWRNAPPVIEGRLTRCGPAAVEVAAPFIINGNPIIARKSAQWMISNAEKTSNDLALELQREDHEWAPEGMSPADQNTFFERAKAVWDRGEKYAKSRLVDYGPDIVLQGVPFLLDDNVANHREGVGLMGRLVRAKKAQKRLAGQSDLTSQTTDDHQEQQSHVYQNVRTGQQAPFQPPQEESREWVPDWMDEKQEKAFIARLRKCWGRSDKFVKPRLARYRPENVTLCYGRIMSDNERTQTEGAKMLVGLHRGDRTVQSRTSVQQAQEVSPDLHQQEHTRQQASYQGQHSYHDPYGGHYSQQNPYGYDYSQQNSYGGSYDRYNDVDR